MREGDTVWRRRFMEHLDVDYTMIEPGDLYVCDHTQCDFWVADGDGQIRPWLTAIMDCRRRCVVGWHLGPSPHTDAILSAMLGAFQGWAVPDRMRIDNGKDFTSKIVTGVTKSTRDELRKRYGADWQRVLKRDADLLDCVDARFTGIVPELGIELVYAIPYSPWSKGEIERWFGTFHDQCGKSFATYCGRNTLTRPECLAAIRSGYTKDQKRALRSRHGRDWKKHAVLRIVDQSAVPTMNQPRAAIEASHFEAITTADVSSFITNHTRARGLAPKTAKRYREIIVRLFNWAMKQRGIRMPGERNPAAAVERYREHAPEIRYLTLHQIDEQLKALQKTPSYRQWSRC